MLASLHPNHCHRSKDGNSAHPSEVQSKTGPQLKGSEQIKLAASELTERLLAHPFLVRCEQGTVTLQELRNFLIQHGKYSRYFTRYLCALISNLPDVEDVLRLAENLSEELGFGDETCIPHSHLYANTLRNFQITLDAETTNPETLNLIDTVFMLCRQPGGTSGLGALCLGAEAIVPAMYACVMKGFRSHGVSDEQLEFFAIHVQCDDGHAETMYSILAKQIGQSEANLITALSAGEIAINSRLRFFDSLARVEST
jgi:pyrroloquinoline-quinone synthase